MWSKPKFVRRIRIFARSLIALWIIFSVVAVSAIRGNTEASLPTTIAWNRSHATIPDWSRITLRSLPPIQANGKFTAPSELNAAVGYNLSRKWQPGQTADQYLKLGDLQTSLDPQRFNLASIAQITSIDAQRIPLSALEAIAWQSIDNLVEAIPGLGNYSIQDLPPIQAILTQQNIEVADSRLAELLQAYPEVGQLSLGKLGQQLERFQVSNLPGLQNIPLENLAQWENSTIAGVPGLGNVPLSQMPNPLNAIGMIGKVDVVYGPKEQNRSQTISGSQQAGFQVPCRTNCAHLELTGQSLLQGKQWISGKYQTVKGGFGVLAAANDGQEPTGRHPFGDVFKVAVWDVDEASGQASTALFFRICKRGIPDLGCTPYFLGPVPFLNYRETDPIFTGTLDSQGGASSQISTSEIEPGLTASPTTSIQQRPKHRIACSDRSNEIDFQALADAFSSIEGEYDSVGTFVCDGDGNCGRGLGRYQYMSYRDDVRSWIAQQDGGTTFLAKVDSGASLSQAELERVFPPTVQDQTFKADQTRNIEQARQEGFSGGRLIERVGQIHFGGSGAPIDGGASDIHGRLTLKSCGEELRQSYEAALAFNGKCSQKRGGQ